MKKLFLSLLCCCITLFATRKTETLLQKINAVQNITQLTTLSSILKEIKKSKEEKRITLEAALFLKLLEIKPNHMPSLVYFDMLKNNGINLSLIINIKKRFLKDSLIQAVNNPKDYILTIKELENLVDGLDPVYFKPEIQALLENHTANLLLLYRSLGALIKTEKNLLLLKIKTKKMFDTYWQLVQEYAPKEQLKDRETLFKKALKTIEIVLTTGKNKVTEKKEDELFEQEESENGTIKHPEYKKFLTQQEALEKAFEEFKNCSENHYLFQYSSTELPSSIRSMPHESYQEHIATERKIIPTTIDYKPLKFQTISRRKEKQKFKKTSSLQDQDTNFTRPEQFEREIQQQNDDHPTDVSDFSDFSEPEGE